MRIAFAGSGTMGVAILLRLIESDHDIIAVVQNARTRKGLARRLSATLGSLLPRSDNVPGLAKRLKIPMLWIDRMDEAELAPLRVLKPDLLIVAGFGIILKPPLLELPAIGCLNCHSSLLPRHRGPNPFSAVVLSGDTESGVTFHIMEPGIDTGAIVEQTTFPITDTDTAYTVYQKACHLAADRIDEVVNRIAREGLHGTPQDESLASYDRKLREEDLLIDWNLPAAEIHRKIRACCLSPFARTLYNGRIIRIARADMDAKPAAEPPGTVIAQRPLVKIATSDGAIVIRVAFSKGGIPMIWPAPWSRPALGDRMG